MKYLENLNTSQRAAVTAPLGPVSVLAGPGSGKTRVLTNRIQHLFYHHHFAPSRIRAVTFTQNGTQTMRERLDGDGIRDVRISTFHSLCRSIIDGHYQSVPGLVDLCKAAGVVIPFCWHLFQGKDKQPHLDWYKSDGRLTPDVALWIAFQYACVAFPQRMPPELDFTPEGYQRIVQAFRDIRSELRPVHGFVDVGMPELTLLGNYEGLCRFRDYVIKGFGYELQVADTLHPDYLYMVSEFSGGDPLLESYFIDAYHQLVERYAFIDFTAQIENPVPMLSEDTLPTLVECVNLGYRGYIDFQQSPSDNTRSGAEALLVPHSMKCRVLAVQMYGRMGLASIPEEDVLPLAKSLG